VQTAYVLAYSVIMLNTDQHNATVKKRMTADDFVRNNRGIDDERDLPRPFLEELYNRIRSRQIMMRHTMIEREGEAEGAEPKYVFDASLVANIFALFGRTKELRAEPTEGQIAQLEEFLKARYRSVPCAKVLSLASLPSVMVLQCTPGQWA
jgi:brefeldin A-inhibited guanine nucleotide-exchange protein